MEVQRRKLENAQVEVSAIEGLLCDGCRPTHKLLKVVQLVFSWYVRSESDKGRHTASTFQIGTAHSHLMLAVLVRTSITLYGVGMQTRMEERYVNVSCAAFDSWLQDLWVYRGSRLTRQCDGACK